MNASDRQYLSRFEVDPELDYQWEDLYESDFHCSPDDETDLFDRENILDPEDPDPDEEILS